MQSNLSTNNLSLRKFTESDIPFMQQLYASTRESELALTNFSAEEKAAFVAHQFNAQFHHYCQNYCTDFFDIIELNGSPIGRLFVEHRKDEIRIVDIALTPNSRGQGLGTYFFEQLFEQAKAEKKSVSIHVEHNNPARRLYERLGFKLKTKTNEIYLLMEWLPFQ